MYLEPVFDRSTLTGKLLVFANNEAEAVLGAIAKMGNFSLDSSKEVAQGIVPPQDFVNKASAEVLGTGFRVGDGIFIISEKERKSLALSEAEMKLVRPYYTTTELGRYWGSSRNTYWVIYTDSSFKNANRIKPYPKLKQHLDQFRKVITSDNHPYGLHRSRDEKFFKGEKIISLRKCAQPAFTYTDFDCYVSQTFNIIRTDRIDLKYLIAIFNSTLVAFWLRHKGKMQGHLYQVDKEPLLAIPIYSAPQIQQKPLIALVDHILAAKQRDHDADTTALEQKIDQLVYQLYELTPEQIAVVEEATRGK